MSRFDGFDILIFVGLIFVGYGLYLLRQPLTSLIVGAGLMAVGIIGAWIKGHKK